MDWVGTTGAGDNLGVGTDGVGMPDGAGTTHGHGMLDWDGAIGDGIPVGVTDIIIGDGTMATTETQIDLLTTMAEEVQY